MEMKEMLFPHQFESGMRLEGESGGFSMIYETEDSSVMSGMVRVETEHGPLYLDPDVQYAVVKN